MLLDREGSYLVDAHVLLAVSLDGILHERVRGLEDTAGREEPDSVYQQLLRTGVVTPMTEPLRAANTLVRLLSIES